MKKTITTTGKADHQNACSEVDHRVRFGDRSSWSCVLDERGEVILEQKLSTTAKACARYLGGMPRSRIALETGIHSPWISRLLSELGMK
jgi:transposase